MESLIGQDRCLLRHSGPMFEGWELCDTLDMYKASFDHRIPACIKEGVRWVGSKIPADMFKEVLGTVARFPRRETGYILYYNRDSGEWLIRCPVQYGVGARVDFKEQDPPPPGFGEIGTIHTHPEMGAFWSGTDLADQRGKYGVHIVLGLRGGKPAQTLTSLFTRTGHTDVDLFDLVEEVDLAGDYQANEEWVENIGKGTYEMFYKPVTSRLPAYGVTAGKGSAVKPLKPVRSGLFKPYRYRNLYPGWDDEVGQFQYGQPLDSGSDLLDPEEDPDFITDLMIDLEYVMKHADDEVKAQIVRLVGAGGEK